MTTAKPRSLYEVLGVPKEADTDEIKKAFRKCAMKYHPDKAQGDDEAKKRHNEELFKEMNEAYSVLSDEDKRRQYDMYGTYDNGAQQPQNMNDVFAEMFGGGGGGEFFGMPGMPGMPGMHSANGSFRMFFGQGGHNDPNSRNDVIEIKVSLTELRTGVTKKVSYDVIDRCGGCMGTGAKSASDVVRCITCQGNGFVPQQMGPFLVQQGCPSCGGRGETIKPNKECAACNGGKTAYHTRSFDLRIPQGVPHKHIHRMEGKGSYDAHSGRYNDMVLVFSHDIDTKKYEVDYDRNDVHVRLNIKLDELLCGFVKYVDIYDETIPIVRKHYRNPTKPLVLEKKGLPVFKRKEYGNLVVHFEVIYPEDDDKFAKYHSVFLSMFKKKPVVPPEGAMEVDG